MSSEMRETVAGPRSQEVIGKLLSQIRMGGLKVGDLLPAEVELANQLGVSRATVRIALGELEEMRMISRRRGVGTRLVRDSLEPVPSSFVFELNRYEDLLRYASATRRIIGDMRMVVADAPLAQLLRSRPGSRWLHIDFTRVALEGGNDKPLVRGSMYASAQYEDVLRNYLADYTGSAVALIEDHYGIIASSVHQTIRADKQKPADDLSPEDPVLEIMRYYLDRNDAVLVAVQNRYPASQFTYNITFNRRIEPAGNHAEPKETAS
ncbi:MAG: GntR family transcriptional regulator [Devosia sp.]|nr:GntR family transcriptional regulator [Devosia sp.]